MIAIWTKGIVTTRLHHLALSAGGIVAATALIGVIGVFGISSGRTMTARALTAVPLDWQVALVPGADPAALTAKLSSAVAVRAARTVGYADSKAFVATIGGTTQTTGTGQIVGLPDDYAAIFPGQIRSLLGTTTGVMLAQQTAANLHVTIGDMITLTPANAAPFDVKVEGIIDLLNADPLFQSIGPQKGPNATAPPDNIALLPFPLWNQHFASAALRAGGSARMQIHASLTHANLPPSPDAAYVKVTGAAKNFEVRAAGEAMVGDNLSARLGAVRQDALFARILLLFLGLPGVVLALLLTIAIVRSDAGLKRREQALLGLRGASRSQIAKLAFVEAGLIAIAGSLGGMALAAFLTQFVLHIDMASGAELVWLAASGLAGCLIALAAVLTPALLDIGASSVASRRVWIGGDALSLWRRSWLDVAMMAVAGAIYWHSASTGYQVVLAPEGVATAAVDYTAFLAPLLFWAGAGLLILRLSGVVLRGGRPSLAMILQPLAGRLAATIAAALSRQHRRLATGAALVALAFAFATATAIFNATYNVQLLVDARLTNGADVTVTGTALSPAGADLERIRALPSVSAAEPMQHRFAYVGTDLQDLYGIDPTKISKATDMVDAFFGPLGARATLARLAATPDGILVSQETVNDFQLATGDLVNLRLQTGVGSALKTVAFHLIGVVKEFPTAPRDSFLVANSAYIAAQTGSVQAETILVRASGAPATLGDVVRGTLGPASPLKTTDISQATHLIGSSLTAVDLSTLGAIELAFAVLFVAMATGLTLWLGQAERARTNAILLSLGASVKDTRAFLSSEALFMLSVGLLFGAPVGGTAAWMLVRLLNGVFDPPPDRLTYPLAYFALLLAGAISATLIAVYGQSRWSREWVVREMRAGR
ncbi:MAG: FtsX-like permease family protein [Hyphomicrobiales bacterium]|nr:FtsX-like permease family protein [Hyphomicrobiales bacterium]MDE2115029.1 ABC transporter permease [Hyphomicrobiales bacterium]